VEVREERTGLKIDGIKEPHEVKEALRGGPTGSDEGADVGVQGGLEAGVGGEVLEVVEGLEALVGIQARTVQLLDQLHRQVLEARQALLTRLLQLSRRARLAGIEQRESAPDDHVLVISRDRIGPFVPNHPVIQPFLERPRRDEVCGLRVGVMGGEV